MLKYSNIYGIALKGTMCLGSLIKWYDMYIELKPMGNIMDVPYISEPSMGNG